MKYLISLFLSLLFAASATAQVDSSLYYQYYGGKSPKSKKQFSILEGMIFKVNLAAAICGDIPITAEKVIDGSFGLEVGFGIMPGYYVPENNYLYSPNGNPYLTGGLNPGYSIYVCPKFYSEQYGPDDSFYGGLFRIRHYNLKSGANVQYMDIAFNRGMQMIIADHFTFEYSYGIGIRLRKQTDSNGNVTSSGNELDGFITPIALKVGYMF